ncbi:MAG: hypothetical protein ACYDEX_17420 [Mobilitalea sp.]
MKTIHSHTGISQDKINSQFELKTDSDEIIKYNINYNKELVVDMPFKGKLEERNRDRNSCGWKEDKNHYFKELLNKHPEYFSTKNKERIESNLSPKVDKQYISFFPEYEEFIGDTIIHHHIGQDGQAVGLPSRLHKGYGGVHNVEKALGITQNGFEFSQQVQALVDTGVEFTWDKADEIMDSVIATRIIIELEKRNTEEKIENNYEETETQAEANTENKLQYSKPDKKGELKDNLKPARIASNLQRFVKSGAKYVAKNFNKEDVIKGAVVIAVAAIGAVVVIKNPALIKKPIKWLEKQVEMINPRKVGSSHTKGSSSLAKNGNKIVKSKPVSFGVKKDASEIVEKVTVKALGKAGNIIVRQVSSFAANMDQVSVFKSTYDLYKSGAISLEQLVEKIHEIANLTGKNPIQWLSLLSGRFKDPLADVVLSQLHKY